jgi:short-subunit dehydrogenase
MTEQRVKALVTGASSGLGMDFCRQLADKCDEVLLVARRAEPMENLATELRTLGIEANVLVADLACPIGTASIVEAIRQRGPLTYLVNNAGFSTLGKFAELSLHAQQEMVNLHITATMALSQAAIAGMAQQQQGYIINVASVVALLPFASVAVYGASKAFLVNYSEALQQEVADKGIKVQCLCPGYTRTGFHSTEAFAGFDPAAIPADFWMESADVVKESLAALAGDAPLVIAGEFNRAMYRKRLEQQLQALG